MTPELTAELTVVFYRQTLPVNTIGLRVWLDGADRLILHTRRLDDQRTELTYLDDNAEPVYRVMLSIKPVFVVYQEAIL